MQCGSSGFILRRPTSQSDLWKVGAYAVTEPLDPPGNPTASFPTTRRSLVLGAGHRSGTEARDALATLCQAYWYPIYAFIRRKGHTPDEAEELTQRYFARLLEKGVIAAADQRKGRFRAFLRTEWQHFLIDDIRRKGVRARVLKAVSIEAGDAVGRYWFEPRRQHDAGPAVRSRVGHDLARPDAASAGPGIGRDGPWICQHPCRSQGDRFSSIPICT